MTSTTVTVEEFAARARSWLAANMPPADPKAGYFFFTDASSRTDDDDLVRIRRCRELQRLLFDGGFAGICVPAEYGGQGLTPAHQYAFNRELRGYDFPLEIQASTFIPCLALLLEFGSPEQKLRHIPAMLRGEEVWAQFLSEPDGGSDAAGAATSAVRDGDRWVLNGSKIWTTGGWYSDWAMCLARTNWDVEKHQGLTIFTVPVASPGIEIRRIEMANGAREFCQEFLTDVVVEDRDRLGEVDGGWAIMGRWLHHERTISGGSPYVTSAGGRDDESADARRLVRLAREQGTLSDPRTLELIGEDRALSLVRDALVSSVSAKMRAGELPHHAASMLRLFSGVSTARRATIAYEIAGPGAVVWPLDREPGDPASGTPSAAADEPDNPAGAQAGAGYLIRQAACIGGGTTEMARNVISERLLGLPREARADGGPFRDVPRSVRS
jgi:alkylation response protein AidB-like acyl-CoA dehydrogenase